MLSLQDFRSKAKGLPDLLTYAALIEPGIILQKRWLFPGGMGNPGRGYCQLYPCRTVLCVRAGQ